MARMSNSDGGRWSIVVGVALTACSIGFGVRLGATEAEADQKAAAEAVDPAIQEVLTQLSALGASASPSGIEIGGSGKWKGTPEDLRLLGQLPKLRWLSFDLRIGGATILSELKLPRLDELKLFGVSDDTLATLTRLPQCDKLTCQQYSQDYSGANADKARPELTAEGYRRLAESAGDVRSLQVGWDNKFRRIDDKGLKWLCRIKSLEKLDLYEGAITDDGLAPLASLDKLSQLTLVNCPALRCGGFASLAALQSLRKLNLSGVLCDAKGFAALAGLAPVEELTLSITGFPAAGLKPADMAVLKDLTHLQSLFFSRWTGVGGLTGSADIKQDALVADALLIAVGQIETLKSITIERIATSGEGVEGLTSMPRLEGLSLCPIQLNDRALAALGKLQELRYLRLTDVQTPVSDLHALARCTKLTDLRLINCLLGYEVLYPLAELHSLSKLDLSHCSFREDWSTPLDKLVGVTKLDLSETNANDKMLQTLPAETLETLKELDLKKTKVTADVFELIAKMTNLRTLTIDERITSADALKSLRGLAHLKHVHVASTRSNLIGRETMNADRKLQEALPGKVSVESDQAG